MKVTLKASHQSFLMEDILNWSLKENQLNVFITNIEFIPYDGEYVSAIISYKNMI